LLATIILKDFANWDSCWLHCYRISVCVQGRHDRWD